MQSKQPLTRKLFRRPLFTAGVILSATCGLPAAADVSYNHVGVQYMNQDLDDYNCSQDGLSVYGSLDIDSGIFAQASLTDVGGNGCGSTTVTGGAGYYTKFNPQFDVYGVLRVESISPDAGDSDSGLVLAGGFRGFVRKQLETQVELSHHTVFDGETAISGTAAYWFSSQLAGTMTLGFSSDATTIAFGARMNF